MIKRFKRAGAIISFDVNFRGNLWTGAEAKECIESILPYVDIFFCSEETARLTFLKEGDAKSIMKSFTEEYPISIVASTQRIVHSPKRHTFGSIIYSAKAMPSTRKRPIATLRSSTASEAAMPISQEFCTAYSHTKMIFRGLWSTETLSVPLRTPFPVT